MHKSSTHTAFIVLIAVVAALISGCSKTKDVAKIQGFAQGTTYHFSFTFPDSIRDTTKETQAIETEAVAELQRLDASISNYRDDSVIERFNAYSDTNPHEVNREIVSLVEQAHAVSIASHGCYDLTIKPLFDLWGFKKDVFNLPDEKTLSDTLQGVGMDNISVTDASHLAKKLPQTRIDLSSIGQGYSVGRIAAIFEQHGITNYIIEIGGELRTQGKKPDGTPWRIALEKPLPNERKLQKIVVFESGKPLSLMTSGTYRHYFDSHGKRYSHILDPRTGKPVEHNSVSVTVLHEDPTTADAWSTALLCLGSEEGLRIADENHLVALYIDQVGDQLIEKRSQKLQVITDVRLD